MVSSLFGNSNRKLRSTFWGSPFTPVDTNQTEYRSPLTNFSVLSRFQTHDKTSPFFGFKPKRMWNFNGKLVNRLPLCFRHRKRIFLSNGRHPWFHLCKKLRKDVFKIATFVPDWFTSHQSHYCLHYDGIPEFVRKSSMLKVKYVEQRKIFEISLTESRIY